MVGAGDSNYTFISTLVAAVPAMLCERPLIAVKLEKSKLLNGTYAGNSGSRGVKFRKERKVLQFKQKANRQGSMWKIGNVSLK